MKMKTTITGGLLMFAVLSMSFKFKSILPTAFQVKYIVSCTDCNVFYRDQDGHSVCVNEIKGEWEHSYSAQEGHFAYVLAEPNKERTTASVKMIVNDKVRKEEVASDRGIFASVAEILYLD